MPQLQAALLRRVRRLATGLLSCHYRVFLYDAIGSAASLYVTCVQRLPLPRMLCTHMFDRALYRAITVTSLRVTFPVFAGPMQRRDNLE